MSRVVSIILPNSHKLWVKGISLSVYSRSYDHYTHEQDFTELGRMVHDYKYQKWIKDSRKSEIVSSCGNAIIEKLQLQQSISSKNFNCLISVPPNVNSKISLPREVTSFLSSKIPWLIDSSESIQKTKDLPPIKNITDDAERSELLSGAYRVDMHSIPKNVYGFLIVDDIFSSGATVREISRTLKRVFPEIPIYVITLTHLKKVWG